MSSHTMGYVEWKWYINEVKNNKVKSTIKFIFVILTLFSYFIK